jgi:hypothetical protein
LPRPSPISSHEKCGGIGPPLGGREGPEFGDA